MNARDLAVEDRMSALRRGYALQHRQDRKMAADDGRTARHLTIGASLSASFVGLLAMAKGAMAGRAVADDDHAGTSPDTHTGGITEPSLAAIPSTGALAYAAPDAPLPTASAGLAAPTDTIDAASPLPQSSGDASAGVAMLARSTGAPEATDASLPQVAQADIGGVALSIGAVPASILDGELPGSDTPEENLGDIGANLDGQAGDDLLAGTDADDRITGSDADDRIAGAGGADVLLGRAGNDEIDGGDGDDRIDGGDGNDRLLGGAGNDEIDGGTGDDILLGGDGNDILRGGAGNDRLEGGAGIDELHGGSGDDTLVMNDMSDIAIETSEGADKGGRDTLEVTDGYADSLAARLPRVAPEGLATFVLGGASLQGLSPEANGFLQSVDPDIENIRFTGHAAQDAFADGRANELYGNDGDNRLWGNGGDDILMGGDGGDWLYGGDGDDTLAGGDGDDMLYGGAGDDTFVLGLAEEGTDTVFDQQGHNLLRLDGAALDLLDARLDGADLVLAHNGKDVARVDGFEGHRDAFAGLEIDGEVHSLDDFLREELAGGDGANADDMLTAFFNSEESRFEAPETFESDDRWGSLDEADHELGLHEDAAASSFTPPATAQQAAAPVIAAPAQMAAADAAAGDMLQGFLNSGTDPFTGEADMLAGSTSDHTALYAKEAAV